MQKFPYISQISDYLLIKNHFVTFTQQELKKEVSQS